MTDRVHRTLAGYFVDDGGHLIMAQQSTILLFLSDEEGGVEKGEQGQRERCSLHRDNRLGVNPGQRDFQHDGPGTPDRVPGQYIQGHLESRDLTTPPSAGVSPQ